MIKLYRETQSARADAVEAEFREIVLGYDREIITPEEAVQRFGAEHTLPIITNNERIVSGEALFPYVKELQSLMRDWQAFQGDWCYVNDMGDVC